jgi:cysteine desulfurase family protein (TIGR01976 family)
MLDVSSLRRQFPALQRTVNGRTPVFLDGPAGTQVPRRVIDAVAHYLAECNSNTRGPFTLSRESDRVLREAREAVADFLGAASADEVVFGPNMTTLTFALSRAFARTLKPGDRVLVTRLDHDANVHPWVVAAREAGAEAEFVDIRAADCSLDLDDLARQLGRGARLVAVTCASNAVGTLTDVRRVARMAHDAGALVFADAVHYAPHGPVDVRGWGCDFLACSAYKFFGPHVGILWARRELLEELPAYKVRPAPEDVPSRWMTGTQNHEGIAGVAAAVDYLAELGDPAPTRRARLLSAMEKIRAHEMALCRRLLEGLADRPRFRVWGVARPEAGGRVPTVALAAEGCGTGELARHLAGHEVYSWAGNMYAVELSRRLGLEGQGGVLRLGLVHYNTVEDVDRALHALDELP